MKTLKLSLLFLAFGALVSCGGLSKSQPKNAEDFTAIQNDLADEFGADAYYTDLNISYDESIGLMISTTVTKDPSSMKMGEWTYSMGNWNQTAEVTVEIPEGTKVEEFMFQLGEKVSLTKLGEVTEKAMAQLSKEKNIENPALSMAFVKFPDTGSLDDTEYTVNLEPENGGTSFSFYYTLDGELREMDY